MAGRNTTDQLLLAYSTVSKNTDLGEITDAILLDVNKAFDMVSHDLMINKLKSTGIQDKLINWLSSFLHGRQVKVYIIDRVSQPRDISSGVPQGSGLGPLLFLVYLYR